MKGGRRAKSHSSSAAKGYMGVMYTLQALRRSFGGNADGTKDIPGVLRLRYGGVILDLLEDPVQADDKVEAVHDEADPNEAYQRELFVAQRTADATRAIDAR